MSSSFHNGQNHFLSKLLSFNFIFSKRKHRNNNIYHEKYLWLLILVFFGFCLILYYLNKKSSKIPRISQIFVSEAVSNKKNMLKYLLTANYARCITLLYMLLVYNKTGFDLVSLINLLCHELPSFLFFLGFYIYISFIIEKYYLMLSNQKRMFDPQVTKYIIYLSIIVIIISVVMAILKNKYKKYSYMIFAVMSINYLILSMLYFAYGYKFSKIFREKINSVPSSDQRDHIFHKRILDKNIHVTCLIGISYSIRGVIDFLIALGVFGKTYPSFINANLWDFFIFGTGELYGSYALGFSRTKTMNDEIKEKFEDILNDPKNLISYEKDDNENVYDETDIVTINKIVNEKNIEKEKNFDEESESFLQDK